ncbi:unnamed protein product (plasmid) [Mycetohabitans rhizoxinica HKI 454]|uniref:Uncharacterized protein n=1 Tax=Mycetohabitans rhizoxinica (strain DSM 19002 / CIP 109453 / HKI 454) TaxID=882378 RepID=E5AUR7_MYCRK|nr:unnamed protein product [Mycetohabitans rhizoxinica HKI 454]
MNGTDAQPAPLHSKQAAPLLLMKQAIKFIGL